MTEEEEYNDLNSTKQTPSCGCDKGQMCHAAGMLNISSSSSPAALYQRLKLIQNTVRVPASLYLMNIAALSAYQSPKVHTQSIYNSGSPYIGGGGVNWNQMSDRKVPHVQNVVTANPGKSSTRHTITRLRPGAGSPGGIGVDIKHNSYERYLNRIKGKGPISRGPVPPHFGRPIDFNLTKPIYGGKTLTTSIVSTNQKEGCNGCDNNKNVERLYGLDCGVTNKITNEEHLIPVPVISHKVGDYIFTGKCKRIPVKEKAQIISISGDREQYVVQFADCCTMTKHYSNIKPFVECAAPIYPCSYIDNGLVETCVY